MPFVSITRLRIRPAWFMPRFVLHALGSLRQCKQASGFLEGSLLPDRKRTFWTMTLWQDQAAMELELTARVETRGRATLPADALGERAAWRDRRLMALAQHKCQMDAPA